MTMTATSLESAATSTGGTGAIRAKEEDEEMYTPLSENEGGDGSTSATPPKSAAVLRVRLSTATTAPPALKSPFVANDNDWSDFWTQLQPTMRRVKRQDRCIALVLGATVLLAFVLAIVVIVATAWLGGHVYPDYRLVIGTVGTLLNYALILGTIWIFCIYQGRTYLALQNELQSAVFAYEQSTRFQERHGWHIDCQHDPMGFVLYISNNAGTSRSAGMEQRRCEDKSNEKGPIHVHANGSLHILLSAHFFGWSPVSLSHLQSKNNSSSIDLPGDGYAALQQAEWWSEFWSKLAPLALHSQRAQSLVAATYWCMGFWAIQMIVILPHFPVFVRFLFWMALWLLCEWYAARCASRLVNWLQQHQAHMYAAGYFMYLRGNVHEFSTTRYMGIMYTTRYLVVVPMAQNGNDSSTAIVPAVTA